MSETPWVDLEPLPSKAAVQLLQGLAVGSQERCEVAPCCNAAATVNQDFGYFERIEDFAIEQLVSQFAVKCFVLSILPRATRFDEQRPGAKSA